MGQGQKNPSNKFIILDLIFYAAFPYVLWKFGRNPLGDYAAMLISTIPGFLYTVYRFVKERQFNIAGLFIISSLFLGTVVNLLSGSAELMLWNSVYLGLFYTVIHIIAFVIRRPFALYFAVDFAHIQGYERKSSKKLFHERGIFKWFQMIQLLFIVRGLFMAGLKAYLLNKYGVDGYDQMLIYRQIVGWVFGVLIMGMFFYTKVPIQNFINSQLNESQERKTSIPT
ncbi:VC0807 family protein [Virgibacillus soli]|uniref:VC0807 family protein n=1 Tax=Paracerasibacillus soli TaxID=480284 RepID=A0ABU5CYL8_9BACI|nr:VC0807 family protein [Virgibacillus soli]MDY0410575.1 VC0807 family protein [Virgibacillus soli]